MPLRLAVLRGEVGVPSVADDEPDRALRNLEDALRRGRAGGVERVDDTVEFRGVDRWPVSRTNLFYLIRWGRFEPTRTPSGVVVRYRLDLTGLLIRGVLAAAAVTAFVSAAHGFGWWSGVAGVAVFVLFTAAPLPVVRVRYRGFIRRACLGLD
ncbi:MAG: hypothetical protein K2X82_16480 [Gemmataceae bacterium]|nr:hypothetical protein [Gemmataceae bacterium]